MKCHHVDRLIEDLAAGDAPPDAMRAHLAECARCAAALANARLVERALGDLPPSLPPPEFAQSVMARIRRERWRSEQVLDWAFNTAVATGIVLIAIGLGGLAWATGMISLGGDMMTALSQVSPVLLRQAAEQSQTIVLAALLLSVTLGLWWWVETETST